MARLRLISASRVLSADARNPVASALEAHARAARVCAYIAVAEMTDHFRAAGGGAGSPSELRGGLSGCVDDLLLPTGPFSDAMVPCS